ncbi:CPBP family intramembrane metalloprotease [Parvibaculum sp.]|uniref:CPBP family intramembrane glutamic endopeptidase n=1 Tax=Parvibaculum sp. TaxID=2024848 RepID=UPI000EDAC31B|nr:CPBP family intramembrane metalloprotease [Parvibaculum sp.]MBO6667922.1 CPBP family intramembrane metalloprotease [Parvibaculum sp.]MBO6690535.1 CPBP family intramembrane metalloprotease [Parvibaculum sp.]MBO6714842.1 CPBP family intramembrane metalloprotease [Parvibaculum sp.]HAC59661.1 CPBP family intramembrane metalloprotease [Rhodobiaceae bacterium]
MVYRYFIAVLLASIPFWLIGHTAELPLPIDLPASSLMAFTPALLALLFVRIEKGPGAAKALLARSFDWNRVPRRHWFLVAFLFMPVTLALSYAILRLMGAEIPDPQIPLLAIPLFFLMFFTAALGEEIGWQGYAYDRLMAGRTAIGATFILALVWLAWHVVPYFQTGRSLEWIVWHCLVTILLRVVTVWLYVNGGRSVFIAALFHTMSNVAFFLFPVYGSHYDPAVTFVPLALACAGIVFLWSPRTLAHFRYTRED